MSRPAFPKVQWNNAGTVSGNIKLDGNQIVGFYLPSTIVSTSIKFNAATTAQLATSAFVWYPVNDSTGAQISFTVNAGANGYYGFSQDQIAKFQGAEILQMVSDSSEAANQNIMIAVLPRPSI